MSRWILPAFVVARVGRADVRARLESAFPIHRQVLRRLSQQRGESRRTRSYFAAIDPSNPANFAEWVKVHDRLRAGEMPPKAVIKRPDPAEQQAFLKSLAESLERGGAQDHRRGRPRHRAPPQCLRIRERPARSASRSVAPGERPVSRGWRGLPLQQEFQRAGCFACSCFAIHDGRRLRHPSGHERA